MSKAKPSDPLRVHCLELCNDLSEHTTTLRDYALTPGNAWLAKGELQQITQIISDLETLLEQIKQADQQER
jgi:hypothetical protein